MEKRIFGPGKTLAIVLEALETGKITETCKKHGIPPQFVYDWKHLLKNSAKEIYQRKKPARGAGVSLVSSIFSTKC